MTDLPFLQLKDRRETKVKYCKAPKLLAGDKFNHLWADRLFAESHAYINKWMEDEEETGVCTTEASAVVKGYFAQMGLKFLMDPKILETHIILFPWSGGATHVPLQLKHGFKTWFYANNGSYEVVLFPKCKTRNETVWKGTWEEIGRQESKYFMMDDLAPLFFPDAVIEGSGFFLDGASVEETCENAPYNPEDMDFETQSMAVECRRESMMRLNSKPGYCPRPNDVCLFSNAFKVVTGVSYPRGHQVADWSKVPKRKADRFFFNGGSKLIDKAYMVKGDKIFTEESLPILDKVWRWIKQKNVADSDIDLNECLGTEISENGEKKDKEKDPVSRKRKNAETE